MKNTKLIFFSGHENNPIRKTKGKNLILSIAKTKHKADKKSIGYKERRNNLVREFLNKPIPSFGNLIFNIEKI